MKAQSFVYWICSIGFTLAALSLPAKAELLVRHYESKFVQASELKKRLQELYPEVQLSAQHNQLFVRATTSQLAEIMELLPVMDKMPLTYTLSFSAQDMDKTAKTYSSIRVPHQQFSFTLLEGQALSYSYSIEEQRLLAISPLHGAAISNASKKSAGLNILLTTLNDQQVQIEYAIADLKHHQRSGLTNKAVVNLGKWLPLIKQPSDEGKKSYGSASNKGQLYIKINR